MANTHTQALSLVQQSLGQWPTHTHRLCPSYYSHWGNGQHTHTGFVPRTTVTGAMANTHTQALSLVQQSLRQWPTQTHRLCPSYYSHWGNGQHTHTGFVPHTTVTGAMANTHTQALSLVQQSLGQWPTHTHRLCPSYNSHWGNGQHIHTSLSLVQQSLGQWPTHTHRLCPSYNSHWGNGQHTHTHRLCPSYNSHWGNGQHIHTSLSLVQQSLGQWPTLWALVTNRNQ